MRGVGVSVDFWPSTGEVKDCFAFLGVDGNFELDRAAIVHVVDSAEISTLKSSGNIFKQVSDAQLGVVLDVAHVELDDFFSVIFDQGANQGNPFLISCNLCFEII